VDVNKKQLIILKTAIYYILPLTILGIVFIGDIQEFLFSTFNLAVSRNGIALAYFIICLLILKIRLHLGLKEENKSNEQISE
jgi:hypothetical protein